MHEQLYGRIDRHRDDGRLMPVLTLGLALATAYALATLLRSLLRDGRVWLIAPMALTVGVGLLALALLWLGRHVPYVAIMIGLAALIWAAAMLMWWRRRQQPPAWAWGLSAEATAGYAAVAILVATGTLVLWSASVWGGLSHENLFQHTGLTTMLAREPAELRHPLEPDHPLSYRLAYHYVAAGLTRASGLSVPMALQLVTVGAAVLAVLNVFAAAAARASVAAGFVASIGFWAGGSIAWVLGWLPDGGAGSSLDRLLQTLLRLPGGLTQPGPLGQMPGINGSLVFGFMLVPVGIWLYAEMWAARGSRAHGLALVAALTVGALAAAAESLFAVVVVALAVDLVRRAVRGRLARPSWVFVVILAATVVTAAGVLSAEPAAGDVRGRLGAAFSGPLFAHAPTVSLANLPQAEIPGRIAARQGWIPMWSGDFLIDVGFTPILAAAALAWLAYRRHTFGALLAGAALVSFGVTAAITLHTYPWDTFRFTQSGMVLGYAAAGLAAGDATARGGRRIWSLARAAFVVAVIVAAGGYAASAAAWPELAARREGADYALDTALTERLAALSGPPPRLVVVPGATDWFGLHHGGDEAVTKYVVAAGGVVPMGHDWYGYDTAYRSTYRVAYDRFDIEALRQLRITHLYVVGEKLDGRQRQGLDALLNAGLAHRIDSIGGGALRRDVYALALDR